MAEFLSSNAQTILGMVLLGLIAPWLIDVAAGVKIAFDNWRKGKPTFVIGTKFDAICLDSGQTHAELMLEKKDLVKLYFRNHQLRENSQRGGLVVISKRHFVKMIGHGQVVFRGGQNTLRAKRDYE